MHIRIGPPNLTLHYLDRVLVTARDGSIDARDQHGFFCADTRLVSSYHVFLNGKSPRLVNSTAIGASAARYEFLNEELDAFDGPIPQDSLHMRLDRVLGATVCEEYRIWNYSDRRVECILEIELESDFADIFDVRDGRRVRRGSIDTVFDNAVVGADATAEATLTHTYERDDFHRAVRVSLGPARSVRSVNGRVSYRLAVDPGGTGGTSLQWHPVIDGEEPDDGRSHELVNEWRERITCVRVGDPDVQDVVDQAVEDLGSLRLRRADGNDDDVESWVPAAGIPWFVTLFGRDALIVGLQTMLLGPGFGRGAVRAHVAQQGSRDDAAHDEQPGRIAHELRRGELAHFDEIPQTPYYGTHDANSLFVRVVGEIWKWTHDRAFIEEVRDAVERAVDWIDRDGDLDGDGLQEYASRAGAWGFYNLSWKDASDAIVGADGRRAELPIATCELQGYVVAAKEAWARVLDEALGETATARRLRDDARRMRDAIEERFWWPEERTYVLGLDGRKQPIRSVASNAGHLLWCEAVVPERAACVVDRLLADDMWSGWGLRTLSARHPSFNPFSYQRGSIWPHDNAIFVDGCCRYGHVDAASRVARALFDAALRFEDDRLPEVFAGLQRDAASVPARYVGANVPQAWASGAVIHAVTALCGVEAGNDALTVRGAPPEWLGPVALRRVRYAGRRVDIELSDDGVTRIMDADASADTV